MGFRRISVRALSALTALSITLVALGDFPAAATHGAGNLSAADTDEPPIGDPIWADLPGGDEPAPLAAAAASTVQTLLSNAVTSGLVDPDSEGAYAGTRSSSPGRLHFATFSGGKKQVNLPAGSTGSWDMAKSGSALAVGLNGSSTGTAVAKYVDGIYRGQVSLPKSHYVMSLVEDTFTAAPGNGRYFWAGTYHANGARLFRVDLTNFTAVEHTPTAWAKDGYRYVRSLAADPDGVTVGMGNRAQIWRVTSKGRGAKPVPWGEANEAASSGATSYAAATYIESPAVDPPVAQAAAQSVEELPEAEIPQSGEEPMSGEIALPQSGERPVEEIPAETPVQGEDDGPLVEARAVAPLSYSLVGTSENNPQIIVVDNTSGTNGTVVAKHRPAGDLAVDRIAVDSEAATAWFATRPLGALYRLDLKAPRQSPTYVGTPIWGSETRALSAANGMVYGITGTSELWMVDAATMSVSHTSTIIAPSAELPDQTVQGVAVLGNWNLAGGHWRYQAYNDKTGTQKTVMVPGEPKAQTVVGNVLYSALYPSASIVRLDANLDVTLIARIGSGQSRPAAIKYLQDRDRLLVATGPEYGLYGGGLSLVDPNQTEQPVVYSAPVGQHRVRSLAAHDKQIVLGTNITGEALPALSGQEAEVVSWKPEGNRNTGTVVWRVRPGVKATFIAGLEMIPDQAGAFTLAATNNGYLLGIDEAGSLLWKQKVGSAISGMDQNGDYTLAIIDGTVREVAATRSSLTVSASPQLKTKISYLQLDRTQKNGRQQVGSVSAGTPSNLSRTNLGSPRLAYRNRGATRYETAVANSRASFVKAGTVVLARGDDFADALTAGPLAAALNAPILLVRGGRIDAATAAEMNRLGATRAIPIGGYGVIPKVLPGLPSRVKLDNAS